MVRKKVKTTTFGLEKVKNNYLTRSAARRRLGLDADEFRQLCILRGIFPRRPTPGHQRVVYHVKDIRALVHEPLIAKFAKQKILEKRMFKALHKRDSQKAKLYKEELDIDLDISSVLRERYPSFVDALRDMDDALSLVALFASMPAQSEDHINGRWLSQCRQLMDEWMLLTSHLGCVTKTFASIKGYYFEVELLDQKVVWLMPHEFSNISCDDVDFRVMRSFLLLYSNLVKFVLFKLYAMAGFHYPPSRKCTTRDGRFTALSLETLPEKPLALQSGEDDETSAAQKFVLVSNSVDQVRRRSLFGKQIVYVSRETPFFPLIYLLRACGAKSVGWDEVKPAFSPLTAKDPSITHHVVDRPQNSFNSLLTSIGEAAQTRSFVQPQWIFDCVNVAALIPMQPYAVGVICPPHVSPFEDTVGYVPEQQKVLESWANHSRAGVRAAVDVPVVEDSAVDYNADLHDEEVGKDNEVDHESTDIDSAADDDSPEQEAVSDDDSGGNESSDESNNASSDNEEKPGNTYEANDAGAKLPSSRGGERKRLKESEVQRAALLLSRKKRRIYNSVKRQETKLQSEKARLEEKARQLKSA